MSNVRIVVGRTDRQPSTDVKSNGVDERLICHNGARPREAMIATRDEDYSVMSRHCGACLRRATINKITAPCGLAAMVADRGY